MSISFDDQQKTLSLSVRDLCSEELLGGSLTALPLQGARMQLGSSVHEIYQAGQLESHVSYQKEKTIRHLTASGAYTVFISGRIDGVYQDSGSWILEEVKSTLHTAAELKAGPISRAYLLQLKIYLYFWLNDHPDTPASGHLIYIDPEGKVLAKHEVQPEVDQTRALVEEALTRLIAGHEAALAVRSIKQLQSAGLGFPFPQMRRHQDRMIELVEETLREGGQALIAAPTGIGKTAAALYAALKFALQTGRQVYFLTSKTTQQRIVNETLHLWTHPEGPGIEGDSPPALFNSLTLRAKEKSCANDVVCCHESRCPFARDFFAKIEESHLCEKLAQKAILTPEILYQTGIEHQVCPFELSLEMTAHSDLVVGDYNYIYDPQAALKRIFEQDYSHIILIIDEAHNLYARAREYYSPSLSLMQIQKLKKLTGQLHDPTEENCDWVFPELQQAMAASRPPSRSFIRDLSQLLADLELHFEHVVDSFPECRESPETTVSLDAEWFQLRAEELSELMQRYLIYRGKAGVWLDKEDQLLDFFYGLASFCRVLELGGEEFVHILEQNAEDCRLKIFCLDPSRMLRVRNQGFHAVIGMSATLTPLPFYRDVLGFEKETRMESLLSPFPPENRRILVLPQVSTAYKQRTKNAGRIAEIIEKTLAIRPGNYFAFFPSFAYLDEVATLLNPVEYRLLRQERFMPDYRREALLEKLSDPEGCHLVLAVQGGIFSEGVDYPGELAVGAIVVGPGLPRVCFEQELIRQYYEAQGGHGFDYAYLYPGMNRVVQSAGRIIRTETDRGVILLLDSRFAHENYLALLPRHWYERSPEELIVTGDFTAELKSFWNE
jgi:DNA excision repair protein ERCC-2